MAGEDRYLKAESNNVWKQLQEKLEGIIDDSAIMGAQGEELRVLKHHISELDGSLVVDVRMNEAGQEGDVYPWLCQIYTTVAESVDMEQVEMLSAKLAELNFYIPFGSFGVFGPEEQVYHNYTFAARDSEEELVSLFSFYLERILEQLSQLYPLALLLTASPEDVDVQAIFREEE